jgi:poly(A) polymerase/tRNA nucleotidyltransferase (CCA-adding enzyme)
MSAPPALTIPPPDFIADPALAPVLAALPEARIAGGAVRDTLAGRPVADIDLATPRRPSDVVAALTAAGIRAVPTGLAHGTITAVSHGRGFEITTLRRDVATDGRHAVVDFTDDWQADAARRDFTMNALSMTRDGAVFDYFGGIADLRAGRVRFVGDPATRIAEDYLRILRCFRFHARYGRDAPDPAALAAIRAGVPGLARLSAERVWSELGRILAAPDPRGAVALMAALGVLAAVLPEGADPARLDRLVAAGAPPDPLLRLAALLTGDPLALAARLRLAVAERDRLLALRAAPLPPPDADDATLRRLLCDTDPAVLRDRIWLAEGDGRGGARREATGEATREATGDARRDGKGDGPGWAALRARLEAMQRPVFPLEGRDVLALGLPPGPQVGALLRAVRDWWRDGGCVADAAACRAELARRAAG